MKRLLFLVVLLAGCSGTIPDPNPPTEILDKNNNVVALVGRFTYKGHRYLRFGYRTHVADSGTVHDPDCACFAKPEKE